MVGERLDAAPSARNAIFYTEYNSNEAYEHLHVVVSRVRGRIVVRQKKKDAWNIFYLLYNYTPRYKASTAQ